MPGVGAGTAIELLRTVRDGSAFPLGAHVRISGHKRPTTPVTAPLRSSTTGAVSHAGDAGLHLRVRARGR